MHPFYLEKMSKILAGVPGEKPQVTSDKLPHSPSKFPCIQLWTTRRIWNCIKSDSRPYSTHPFCVAWLCLSCSAFVNYSQINYFTYLGKNQAIGDILVLCGAIMYGISNVAQEFVVKNFSRVEFLGMLGFFGTIISAIQMWV